MSRETWELASWIATTVGFLFTIIGLIVVVVQLSMQRKQSRRDALNALDSEFDTHDARLAREYIYKAPVAHLRVDVLHSDEFKVQRKYVEDTLAMLERMAYPIIQKQLPSKDAFNLYGGVLLTITFRLWPYIQDQRSERAKNPLANQMIYRRYLEMAVHEWAPDYAEAIGLSEIPSNLSTAQLFKYLFPKSGGA